MKERLAYVDAAKGISILMIMLGHITALGNPVDTWMSSMKVSCFYIISGFLICYTGSIKKRSFKEFSCHLLKTLAWPYLTFSILGVLAKTGYVFLKHDSMEKITDTFTNYFYDSVFLKGINSMWFLPTLFFGELIFYIIFHSPKVIQAVYAVAGVFGLLFAEHCIKWLELSLQGPEYLSLVQIGTRLFYAFGKSIVAAWFLGAGYILFLFYQHLKQQRVKLFLGVVLSVGNVILSQLNSHVDFNMLKYGSKPYLFFVCGLVGSLGMILLLDGLSHWISLSFLDFWGENSLILMCTHTVLGFKTIAYNGWEKLAYIPSEAGIEYICESLAVLVVLLLLEYSVIVLINTKLPFLLRRNA